ncbi:NAD(P)/FAD-dependent oxidoreductase [Halorussus halophilus]|uniref:NAD(P)/FAD-dependent oxidoreductase n=1 Tax=Halorussus halophilus TaxID=2650975 RepID=UPI00130131D6|nr:FAD-dependent oxidoreductase [Halorussus halophilus]
MKVAVIGGGAIGVTAAYDLACRDADVTLFEKGEIAGESTGRAAGVLYDAFAAPEDARVGERSIERFREFSGEGDFEFHETPYVWFAREGDEKRAEAIREQVPRMQEQGRDVAFADAADLEARFPAVDWSDVAVAAVAENTGRTIPATYAELLATKASEEGATVRTGVEAAIELDPPRVVAGDDEASEKQAFDAILVAAGAHTKRLLADAGVSIPLKPYRVQAVTAEFGDGENLPMLYDATEGYYARPHPEGLLAGDGTEEFESDPDEWRRDADESFCKAMAERLDARLWEFDDSPDDFERAWAGLCVATPDYDPLLGELRDGLFLAAGWQGHGFMRAPGLAEAAAEAVLDENPLPEFDPTRFDGDEEFDIVEGMAVE